MSSLYHQHKLRLVLFAFTYLQAWVQLQEEVFVILGAVQILHRACTDVPNRLG